jgi:hypothetical protein
VHEYKQYYLGKWAIAVFARASKELSAPFGKAEVREFVNRMVVYGGM